MVSGLSGKDSPDFIQPDIYVSMRNLRCGRSSPAPTLRSRPNSPSFGAPAPKIPSLGTMMSPSQGAHGPMMEPGCMYGSVPEGIRHPVTPPVNKKAPAPNAGPRRTWIQRHNRRPNTVNIDENTMSGEKSEIFCTKAF